MLRSILLVLAVGLLTGCAMKGDVRRIEAELQQYHEQVTMSDSARAASLAQLADQAVRSHAETQRLLDSVTSEVQRLTVALGDLRGELRELRRELATVQELAGQSQVSLRELRAALESATRYVISTPGDSIEPRGDDLEPERLFVLARQQLERGSPITARDGFQRLISEHPGHQRVPDALRWIGESFLPANPDSAVVYFTRVVDEFPESPQAGFALYRIGLEVEGRGDSVQAYALFERVAEAYASSDAAALACQRFRQSGRPLPPVCRPGG